MSRAVTLVLTHPFDPTADYVVSELNRRGAPVFRCDPGEFPQRLSVTARLDRNGAGWVGSLRLPIVKAGGLFCGSIAIHPTPLYSMSPPAQNSTFLQPSSRARPPVGRGCGFAAVQAWRDGSLSRRPELARR